MNLTDRIGSDRIGSGRTTLTKNPLGSGRVGSDHPDNSYTGLVGRFLMNLTDRAWSDPIQPRLARSDPTREKLWAQQPDRRPRLCCCLLYTVTN